MSDELDLDMLEQDARSAFILHEYKSNRYYVDERGWEGKEPIGGYGYRDKLLAEDFLALIERLRKAEADLLIKEGAEVRLSMLLKFRDARLQKLQRVKEALEKATVRRDPRHRVSMLVNDWSAIVDALADLEEK